MREKQFEARKLTRMLY